MNKIIGFLCGCMVLAGITAQGETLENLSKQPGNETLVAAVTEARYSVREVEDNSGHLWVQNPAQGLNARFTAQGLSMNVREAGSARNFFTRWSAKAFGYDGAMVEVSEGKVMRHAKPGRVEIVREGLVEWYENSAKGLEHGFTLLQAPAGQEAGKPLRVEMNVSGDLICEVTSDGGHVVMRDRDGKEVLRYAKLKVWDATGRILDSIITRLHGGLALEVEDQGAQYPVTIDPVFVPQAYLKASNTEAFDLFGSAIAISADTMVVGAYWEDSSAVGVNGSQTNGLGDSGAAYVFVRNGSTWSQQAYLKASNTEAGDNFGLSVAIHDDTIVVGTHLEDSSSTGVDGSQANGASDSGAAYVFIRNGGTWSQQAYLKASNAEAYDMFGIRVAINGDTIVVGAYGEDSSAIGIDGNQNDTDAFDSGAAYVFVRNGNAWTQQAYLKASNTEAMDMFGYSVAISGDTIVVGAYYEDSSATGVNGSQANGAGNSGAAYVFVRNGSIWGQHAYLKASNTEVEDNFGVAVSISGDTIVVGAFREDSPATGVNGNQANGAIDSGAAYAFVRKGTLWTQNAYLKASNAEAADMFGISVAASGGTVVVGATGEDSSAIGVNGNQADNDATSSGAVYVFKMLPTPGPAITLTSPKVKGKLPANRKITIRGAAFQGYYPLASYQYRLNKKAWKTGGALSGSYSTWHKKVGKAKAGRNTIRVRSFDVAGQSSPVVVRKVKLRK